MYKGGGYYVELEKLDMNGLNDIYALSVVRKEFTKAVNEKWKTNPPWQRYQTKLMQDLAVLDVEKKRAIDMPQYEKLSGEKESADHHGSIPLSGIELLI